MEKSTSNISIFILPLLACIFTFSQASFAGNVLQELPTTLDPQAKYIFFMHGKIVEQKGVASANSADYGFYHYKKILDKLAGHDFIVISEARGSDTEIKAYAKKIKKGVMTLLKSGVPAKNITVSGFSKGGKISLVASSLIGNEHINYVVLAGCIKKAKKFITKFDLDMKGHVLSIVDHNDKLFTTCGPMFKASSGGLVHNEIILQDGSGHGVFYSPGEQWLNPMLDWIK